MSSRVFSQSGNYFSCASSSSSVMMLLSSILEKQRTNISTDRSDISVNEAPKTAF